MLAFLCYFWICWCLKTNKKLYQRASNRHSDHISKLQVLKGFVENTKEQNEAQGEEVALDWSRGKIRKLCISERNGE